MSRPMPHRRNALALILVVGVLGVLAILSICFITLARLERRASQQRIHQTQALLLARSGMEDALARMGMGQDSMADASRYLGEDWDADGLLNGSEIGAEVFRPGVLDRDRCPPRYALRPSWAHRDASGPVLTPVDGRHRGRSGRLSDEGLSYVLKVSGEDGLYVNGGDLSSAGEHAGTYDTVLKRLLGNLAEELGALLTRADGEGLVILRPTGGWTDFNQAASRLGWTEAQAEAFQPYLAFQAWVDRKVIRPNLKATWNPPAGDDDLASPPPAPYLPAGYQSADAWAEIKVGKSDDPPNGFGTAWSGLRTFNIRTNSYAPDFERDLGGRVVGRAPVDLNWARDKTPVLRALLKDLAGVLLSDTDQRLSTIALAPTLSWNFGPVHQLERGYVGIFFKATLSTTDVDAVVSALGAHTGFPTWALDYPDWDRTASFDSWDEFHRFVDLKLSGLTRGKRDLIKANFNPNSDLNKFNPGETFFKSIDKSDLTVYSTEFSLRSPLRRVASLGRVLDPSGRLLAQRTLSVSVAHHQLRLTTQSEFCAGNLGVLDLAGDETSFRRPGTPGFIAQTDSPDPSWGNRWPPISPAASTQGLSLQTYPEPQWPGLLPCPPPAAYDGHLELASLATPAADPGLTFLATWDSGYNATAAAGLAGCSLDTGHGSIARSLLGFGPAGPTAQLNMLYPDGCYSETMRTPGYQAPGNIGDGLQGILSFWVKPAFGPDFYGNRSARGPLFLNLMRIGTLVPGPSGIEQSQAFMLGSRQAKEYPFQYQWGGFVENRYMSPDANSENASEFSSPTPFWSAHRWYLMTFQWNLRATARADFANFCVNDSIPNAWSYGTDLDGGGPDPLLNNLGANCYRTDSTIGPPSFYLGIRGFSWFVKGAADATFDELAIYSRTTAMTESATLATTRFRTGRYVKEDEALDPATPEFTSCVIPLPAGSRIVRADWTLVLPRPLKAFQHLPDTSPWPSANRAYFGTGTDPLSGETAGATLTLMDASGAPLAGRLSRSGEAPLVSIPAGGLKVGVNLMPRLGDNQGAWAKGSAPLLESPCFDDFTLVYTLPQGPRALTWREGE